MTTDLHEGMVGQFNESFGKWKGELEKSSNLDISDAAGTLHLKGNKSIPFPVPEGGKDKRSPDGQIKHRCKHGCDKPALLLEVGWAKTKELKEKAKNYSKLFSESLFFFSFFFGWLVWGGGGARY